MQKLSSQLKCAGCLLTKTEDFQDHF